MGTWNELFAHEANIVRTPQPEVLRFVAYLERTFGERPLRIWDLCCGAGRHTIAMAQSGHDVFASDSAPNGIARARAWLSELDLSAKTAVSDMTRCPWADVTFHGVMSWDALHHNTLENIRRAVDEVFHRVVPSGLFMLTLKSSKADSYGMGREIEPDTFILDCGSEAGVPHHYFDEAAVRCALEGWDLLVLAEQRIDYRQRPPDGPEANPFPYTTWGVLARRPPGK